MFILTPGHGFPPQLSNSQCRRFEEPSCSMIVGETACSSSRLAVRMSAGPAFACGLAGSRSHCTWTWRASRHWINSWRPKTCVLWCALCCRLSCAVSACGLRLSHVCQRMAVQETFVRLDQDSDGSLTFDEKVHGDHTMASPAQC